MWLFKLQWWRFLRSTITLPFWWIVLVWQCHNLFFTKSFSMIRVKKQVFGKCFDLQQMIELKYRGPMWTFLLLFSADFLVSETLHQKKDCTKWCSFQILEWSRDKACSITFFDFILTLVRVKIYERWLLLWSKLVQRKKVTRKWELLPVLETRQLKQTIVWIFC